MKPFKKMGSKIYMLLIMIFFYLPILYTVIFSFNSSRSLTKFGGFSLQWYQKMFHDSIMDMWLLSKAEYLLYQGNSTFSTISMELKKGINCFDWQKGIQEE